MLLILANNYLLENSIKRQTSYLMCDGIIVEKERIFYLFFKTNLNWLKFNLYRFKRKKKETIAEL